LKLDLYTGIQYVQVGHEQMMYFTEGSHLYTRNYKTTGNGISILRNKDSYMDGSQYINPGNLIFLLKLKEL